MAFEYSHLSSPTSKRLLKVLPKSDQVHTQLWEENEDVPYRCLSYTWGEPTPCFPIYINGRSMEVRENLYKFLAVAAQRYANEPLWIDAICINQSDMSEKGVQVQRMGGIYKGALEVFIWLGDDPEFAKYIDWQSKPIRKLQPKLFKNITLRQFRQIANRLAKHPYWNRAWIIQEIYLAQALRVVCGHAEIDSRDFISGWYCYSRKLKYHPISERMWKCDLLKHLRFFVRNIESLLGWTYHTYYGAYRLFDDHGRRPYELDFLDLFRQRAWEADCQDPRDRIYSLLAIHGHQSNFKVDYSESRAALYWRAAEYFDIWAKAALLYTMWQALSFSEEEFNTLSKQMPLRCEVSLQSNRLFHIVESLKVHGPYLQAIQTCNKLGDLICFPEESRYLQNFFSIRRHKDVNASSFQISFNMGQPVIDQACPADSDLWFRSNGEDTRVLDWEAVLRVPEYGDPSTPDWKSKPHFVLKLSYEYVLQCVRLRRDFELEIKRSNGNRRAEQKPEKL